MAVRFQDQAAYNAAVLTGANPARPIAGYPPVLRGCRPSDRLATAARRFQSGVLNDYVTWIVLGLACLGGVLVLVVG